MSWSIPLEQEIADEEHVPRTFHLPAPWMEQLARRLTERGWKEMKSAHRTALSSKHLQLPAEFHLKHLIYKGLLYKVLKTVEEKDPLKTMPLSFPLPYAMYRDANRMKISNAALEVWEQDPYPRLWLVKTEKQSTSAPRLLRNKMDPSDFNKGDVIQKYISDPVLVEGHKFHCRCYVVITRSMNFYLHKEGVMFTALKPYNVNSDDPHVHFTNVAHTIPMDHPDYDEKWCQPRLLSSWKGWRKERGEFALCVRRTRRALLTKVSVGDVGPFRLQMLAYDFVVRDTLTEKKVHLIDITRVKDVPNIITEQLWRDVMVAFILPNTEMLNPADFTNWHAIQEWNGADEFFVEV